MDHFLFVSLGTPEIIMLLFAVGFLFLITYCLLDITRSTFQDSTNKIIWVLIILLAPVVGLLAYLIWGTGTKNDLK